MRKHLLYLLLLLFPFFAWTQQWNEITKVTKEERTAWDKFGNQVAISGDYAVVGMYNLYSDLQEGEVSSTRGAVHVYKWNGENWVFQQKLLSSDIAQDDYFGFSSKGGNVADEKVVAIDGEHIIISAMGDDEDENGGNTLNRTGSVYIFKLEGDTWVEKQKIVASDRSANAYFGSSIAIYGESLVVGAKGSNKTYVFKKENENWVEQQKFLLPDQEEGEITSLFGKTVVINDNYIVIGASQRFQNILEPGVAYVYKKEGGNWEYHQKLLAPERLRRAFFGCSIAISEDYLVIGAFYENFETTTTFGPGTAYVFKRNDNDWEFHQKLVAWDARTNGDQFGISLAIDKNNILVGAWGEDEDENGENTLNFAGSSYLFKIEGDNWVPNKKIVASDRSLQASFGNSVAINGNRFIIGSESHREGDFIEQAGAVYIYELDCTYLEAEPNEISAICSGESTTLTLASEAETVNWYESADSEVTLFTGASFETPELTETTSYWVEINDGICTSPRVEIIVTVNPLPELNIEETEIEICLGNDVVLNAESEGNTINWYESADATEILFTGNEYQISDLSETTSYWVEAVTETGCKSERIEIIVTVNPTPELTVINTEVSVCERSSAVLSASSTNTINWYDSVDSETPIFTGTTFETPELTETTSYWVEAGSEEGCISERIEILITVLPAPVLEAETEYTICSENPASLYASSPNNVIFWYENEEDTEYLYHGNLFVTEVLTENTTFWVEAYNLTTGCTSERIEVTVTVGEALSAPIAEPIQYFVAGMTLADLEVEHTAQLTWYADAQLTIELPETTLVVAGTTYYVTQSGVGCESASTAILVDTFLGNGNLNSDKFVYYPNPVKDVLNFKGKETVKSVQIYDLNGKLILNQNSNSISNINLSTLPKGTYVVKATTNKGINTFKIVKS